MELTKQYISQCISLAANNLRLSSQKIEVVNLLKEKILSSKNLYQDFQCMKRITELSKLAIKLNEIYNFLTSDKVDFLKLSEKFKENSVSIVREVNFLLDSVTLITFKEILARIEQMSEVPFSKPILIDETIEINLKSSADKEEISEKSIGSSVFIKSEEPAKLKEKIILQSEPEPQPSQDFFQNFEETILKPVKELDAFLQKISEGEYDEGKLVYYLALMKSNHDLAQKFNSEIVANMHKIFYMALRALNDGKIMPGRDLAENLRACLIVIVALVKNKDIDIKMYLNRAEEFQKRIKYLEDLK